VRIGWWVIRLKFGRCDGDLGSYRNKTQSVRKTRRLLSSLFKFNSIFPVCLQNFSTSHLLSSCLAVATQRKTARFASVLRHLIRAHQVHRYHWGTNSNFGPRKLFFYFLSQTCHHQNACNRKVKEMKVSEKLQICKLGSVHFWYIINPKKLRILQGNVLSLDAVQS
jgi:hypothetical protein